MSTDGCASTRGPASTSGAPDRGPRPSEELQSRAPVLPLCEVFARFWPYTKPFRTRLFLGLALGLALPVVEAVTIWMFKVLTDEVLVPKDLGAFWPIAGVYVVITAVAGTLGFASSYLSSWLGQHFVLSLRTDLFGHLHSLSLDVLERRRTGDMLARLTGDVDAVEQLVVSGVTRSLGNILRVVLFTGALFWLRWELALAALAVTPLFWVAARSFSRRIKTASREARHRSGLMSTVAEESLGNAPLVQAYQRQQTEVARYHRQSQHRLAAKLTGARLSAGFGPLVDALELAGVLLVVGIGTWQMSQGRLSLGGLLAFVAYLSQVYGPVRSLSRLTNTIYSASAGAERISELLTNTSSVPERRAAVELGRARGIVELDRVTFSYPGASHPSLRGMSMTAHPGEVVALVGPSGAGKSTVAKLILRLYDTAAGAVRLDGHDVRDLSVKSLRANIALLLQETLVFHGTIAENIGYGRQDASVQEVRRAARLADVDEFVQKLPAGYDTVIGERGRWLSGGQRQRVAIARALVRDAPVLILDEPATGLDEETHARVAEPLGRLMAGRTTILIAHDPHTIAMADRVLTLDGGLCTMAAGQFEADEVALTR